MKIVNSTETKDSRHLQGVLFLKSLLFVIKKCDAVQDNRDRKPDEHPNCGRGINTGKFVDNNENRNQDRNI